MAKHKIRDHQESDRDLLYSSWNKGLKHSDKKNELIPLLDWNTRFQLIFNDIWNNKDIKKTIACLPDDPDVILGYVIYGGTIIHWVFVKAAWRNRGIAKSLVPKNIKSCTNLTPTGQSLISKYGIEFKPFL